MISRKEKEVIKRNAELKQQLAANARKLKIEAGLEKVRAVALKMKTPADMLDVCKTISLQLEKLGVKEIRNVQTAIFYESKGAYMNYEYYAKHKKTFITETVYTNHKIAKAFASQMLKGKGEVFITHIKGKKVKDWIAYQKTTNVFIDRFLEKANSLSYYWHSLGPVALGISTYVPLGEDELNLFQRFLKVFELAYKRYMDIEQAMTQARAAQTEAALERVRAVAMSMRKPEDLAEVSEIIFTELRSFGFDDIRNTEIIINKDMKNTVTSYYYSDYGVTGTIDVDATTHPTVKHWMEELKKNSDSFAAVHISEKEMKEWRKYRESLGYLPDPKLNKVKTVEYYSYSIGPGALSVSSFKPITEEQLKTLERFKNVFGLAYRRYADVAKAEAQAREAKIEAALERTRTQSMIMQHSNELDDTLRVFHEQVLLLGIQSAFSFLWLPDEKNDRHIFWAVWSEGKNRSTVFKSKAIDYPLDRNEPATAQCLVDWKSNEPVYSYHVPPAAVENYFAVWQELIDGVEHLNPEYFSGGLYYVEAFMKYGCFGVMVTTDLTEDEKKLLNRFAVEFERTYTRFLDLQKAEAQAREAKIEAALERVRSRANAMHHSENLHDVITEVNDQLQQLGFRFDATGFLTDYSDKGYNIWMANFPTPIYVPAIDHKQFNTLKEVIKRGDDFFTFTLTTDEKNIHFKNIFENTIARNSPEELKEYVYNAKGTATSSVVLKNIILSVTNFASIPYSDAENEILKRFARVFEQSYIRFLDLQKAEAQAREAQIELGLERVRARAMAMQHSDELKELVGTVYNELTKLDLAFDRCLIWVMNTEDLSSRLWMANAESQPVNFYMPLHDNPPYLAFVKAWKERNKRWQYDLYGQVKKEWDEYVFSQTEMKHLPEPVKKNMQATDKVMLAGSFHNFGCLQTAGPELLKEEQFDILNRFAKVFDLTYTRFNDLKQAEAQARESQIQLALERVRARTMAMQKSNELPQAANLLFQQVQSLGMPAWSAGYCIWNEDKSEITAWMSSEGVLQPPFRAPTTEDSLFIQMRKGSEQGKNFHVVEMGGEKLVAHYQYMRTLPVVSEVLDSIIEAGHPLPTFQIMHHAYFTQGFLLFITYEPVPKSHDIFKRFAKVFEQTYTRFLDLQKAEAQSRESQIQLALERVRARTMAMQKSEELPETSYLLFQQVKELGLTAVQNSIAIINEETGFVELSTTIQGHHLPHTLNVPMDDPYVMAKGVAAWRAKLRSIKLQFVGQELKDYNEHRNSFLETKVNFPEDQWIVNIVLFSKGWLSFSSNKDISGETFDLLKRFAAVFEQTYTRFNDLKQAEEQARESQIQLALERVRARTMAMQKSDELMETAVVLFDQLNKLGENIERTIIGVMNEEEGVVDAWATRPDGSQMEKMQKFPIDEPILMQKVYAAWRQQKKSIVIDLRGEELEIYFQFLKSRGPKLKRESFGERRVENFAFFTKGMLGVISVDPNTPANISLYERFAAVFDQTYTRFLDLQKAEAQARESQIELGLERVRARAMAMQKSDELKELIGTVHTELTKLDLILDRCFILIYDIKSMGVTWWMSNPEVPLEPMGLFVKYHEQSPYLAFIDAWKERNLKWQYTLEGTVKKNWDSFLFVETELSRLPDFVIDNMKANEKVYLSASFNNFGCLTLATLEILSDEHFDILLRFAKVFDLTYTRFNDLQKAEAQAREAQIELGLERVRARAMAMQKSDELSELVDTVFKELTKLDFALAWCIINIIDEPSLSNTVWAANPDIHKAPDSYHMKFEDYPFHDAMMKGYKERKTKYIYVLEGDEKKVYDEYLFKETEFRKVPEEAQAASRAMEKYVVSFSFSNFGGLQTVGDEPLSDINLDILERFGKVFDLTYTRFNDLLKAEAQARESQIEAALERVRSRTMAMQRSDELKDAALLLFQQVQSFGVDQWACGYNIWEADGKTCTAWMSRQGNIQPPFKTHPAVDHCFQNFYDAKQRGESFYVEEIGGDEIKTHYKRLLSLPEFKSAPKEFFDEFIAPEFQIFHIAYFDQGYLMFITYKPVPQTWDIFKRFAKVFEQTYTRFLDLQKAEAQAREGQIQLALERVRARTMAMQRSDELSETATVLFEQFNALDEFPERIAIGIVNEAEHVFDIWATQHGGSQMNLLLKLSLDEPHVMKKMYAAWKEQKRSITIDLQGNELEEYFQFLVNSGAQVKREIFGERRVENVATFSKGVLMIITPQPRHNEAIKILERFASAFDLTYTRFLDLQKAEAQTKEAQIQLALERVRARTMAMQHSDELKEAAALLFQQVKSLGAPAYSCGYNIWEENEKEFTSWMSTQDGSIINGVPNIPLTEDANFLRYVESKQKGEQFFVLELRDERMQEHYEYLKIIPAFKAYFDYAVSVGFDLPETQIHHLANFSHGNLLFITLEPCPEFHDVFKRFAAVFEQTYTRFLDLQKAEAQSREAQIEAALERVRSRTMAMQRSDELSETAFILLQQFKALDEIPEQITIGIVNEEEAVIDFWATHQGKPMDLAFKFPIDEPVLVNKLYTAWKEQKRSLVIDLTGKELHDWVDLKKSMTGIADDKDLLEGRRVINTGFFSKGLITVSTASPRPAESIQLLERFAGVFDLTYTRFLDLKKAEAQTRQAKIEAALERVRARALAMQEPEELKDVAQVLRTEMGLLGVEELETSSIYIHPDNSEKVECWYALKDPAATEKRMVSDHFELNLNDTWVGREMQKFYTSNDKQTSIVMQGANRKEWIEYCYRHSPVFSGFYGETIPDRTYHLFKFSHGYIGAAAPGEISNESWRLLSRAASVFSLAYSRFKDLSQARTDLVKLKEEKKRAEVALSDLQSAQKQLVQAEKMASLGELTAGIAHEIQNPLNFVNNFSDVSNELLDEMKAELEKGNGEEAKLIAVDVKENLEKILHHGKRADAIVKGMLQHSRTSTGQKELTDINVLAEEYLRLAYHGLRAKDKFFNAKFETDLDPSITKINIVPQEIGRVILNLINNSFYAVSEKKRTVSNGYEPSVTVSTKKLNDKVEIRVVDNGNGIPQKVLDKIFQPFFTTKPTGQGTGLGLSLSYDIVTKGHDGEIKVETKEGEGSAFTISLPMK